MNQLERITFELNLLNDAVILIQDQIAIQNIPPAQGDRILKKYQTRIHHLSTSIAHQQQRDTLHQLETQRQQLMQTYQSQLTAIQQAIRDLKPTTLPHETSIPTQDTTESPPPPLDTPPVNEPAQSSKRSRLRRLFH
jgi:hypothetical protein